ncbi:ABC transporter permease subunit [Roseibium denhamense]|uniref:Thiamine transport system permease protein n=1 Tax=Roseibium denhamense TaxID=76305 RepID=A0ABY1NZK1_9HYPH|nr:ABC transporter permease subunit [Roseibium denhamense]MTI05121.1 ABC transporter permease subunit [Roseibium denhamense]SMP22779.1 putative thiamine transport system permease protein [Roseibium denhamense]
MKLPGVSAAVLTVLLAGPVATGLAATVLPAFGYLPVLGSSSFTAAPFTDLLQEPGFAASLFLSFSTGLGATLVSLALVIWFTASWYRTRTFQRVTRFLSPILSVPHAAAAIGISFLIAPSGFLVRLVSPWATGWDRPPDVLILNDPMGLAMTGGLIAKEVPFLFLMMLAALNRPYLGDYMKAGESLGYGKTAAFLHLILPQLYPLLRLPILAVLAYATSVVDVALLLGPTTPAPLAPRLVVWMNDPDLTKRLMASAGALVQIALTGLAILTYLLIELVVRKRHKAFLESGRRNRSDRFVRVSGLTLMSGLITVTTASLLLLVIWSMAKSWWFPAALPQRWDLGLIGSALSMNQAALGYTISLGLAAAFISTVLTLWHLEASSRDPKTRLLSFLVFLPLVLPQIGFLFGLKMLFLAIGWDGTAFAVLLAHLVFVLPYAILALTDPYTRLDPRYEKAAIALGKSRLSVFLNIKAPLLLKPILTTFAVALAVSVGQYLPTLMIGAGRVVTITTESVALASGGNRQITALFALLQLLVPLAGFLVAMTLPRLLFRKRIAMSGAR